MEKAGIRLQVHYIPVHTQPFYKKNYGFEVGNFPVTENFYDRAISIPLYPSLTDVEVEKVVEDITSFASQNWSLLYQTMLSLKIADKMVLGTAQFGKDYGIANFSKDRENLLLIADPFVIIVLLPH